MREKFDVFLFFSLKNTELKCQIHRDKFEQERSSFSSDKFHSHCIIRERILPTTNCQMNFCS